MYQSRDPDGPGKGFGFVVQPYNVAVSELDLTDLSIPFDLDVELDFAEVYQVGG